MPPRSSPSPWRSASLEVAVTGERRPGRAGGRHRRADRSPDRGRRRDPPLPALRDRPADQPHAGLRRADRDAGRGLRGDLARDRGRRRLRLDAGDGGRDARRRPAVRAAARPRPAARRPPLRPRALRGPAGRCSTSSRTCARAARRRRRPARCSPRRSATPSSSCASALDGDVEVDAAGRVLEGPDPPGRMRTPVRRGGLALATVVHDPSLAERPDLLDSTIGAAGLAIEIARLRVEVRRQLAEVEASRARIVTAGYEERRRLERDIHDGAQQRLVSIGLALRHLQHQLPDPAPLDAVVVEVSGAIEELRELARGVRPAGLDDGLGHALRELAARSRLQDARRGDRRALRGPDRDRGLLRGQRGARQRRQARPCRDRRDRGARAATAASSCGSATTASAARCRRRARASPGSPTASPRWAAACRSPARPATGPMIVAELPCGS